MWKTEKKINKLLIWAIIWSALIGAGWLSMTPKGKSILKRFFGKSKKWKRFFVRWFMDFKKEFFGGWSSTKTKKWRTRKRVKNDDM